MASKQEINLSEEVRVRVEGLAGEHCAELAGSF